MNGTSLYWGIGGSNIKNGYLSKLRMTNILAEAQIPVEAFTCVQKIAKSFRDPIENAFTTNQYYVAFMRLENISEPDLEREGIKVIRIYNHKISVPKSSVPIAFIKNGIIPVASFMIGIPFEDINDVKETFSVMKKINTYFVQIHICSPLIGTDLCKKPAFYEVTIDYNKLESCSIDNEPIMETKYFTRNEIFDLYLEGLGIAQEKLGEMWKYNR
ncbi:MAG: hypothetical protein AB1410_05985 [Acidobacteriota bacterium]